MLGRSGGRIPGQSRGSIRTGVSQLSGLVPGSSPTRRPAATEGFVTAGKTEMTREKLIKTMAFIVALRRSNSTRLK